MVMTEFDFDLVEFFLRDRYCSGICFPLSDLLGHLIYRDGAIFLLKKVKSVPPSFFAEEVKHSI